ncbi:MAG: hypothetical protein WC852_04940 [Candidatus Nanoarchaeia archaeon]
MAIYEQLEKIVNNIRILPGGAEFEAFGNGFTVFFRDKYSGMCAYWIGGGLGLCYNYNLFLWSSLSDGAKRALIMHETSEIMLYEYLVTRAGSSMERGQILPAAHQAASRMDKMYIRRNCDAEDKHDIVQAFKECAERLGMKSKSL